MKGLIAALGLSAALLPIIGCQGKAPRIEPVQSQAFQDQNFKPPTLHDLHGPKKVAVGNPFTLFIGGDAGSADLEEVVFQVWAAGRGSVETGAFPLPANLRRNASGKIEISTLASVGFINSADFELLQMEIRVWLRDTAGRLSAPKVHRFEFDERAYKDPPLTPPKGRDYSVGLGTIQLEIFPLDFNDRSSLRRRRLRF